MTSLFSVHDVLDLVNGTEAIPSPSSITAHLAYRKKLATFHKLITTGMRINNRMLLQDKNLDSLTPHDYWTALKSKFDLSNNTIYATNVRDSFEDQTWNPDTTPIRDFVDNLMEHKMLFDNSTKYKISFEEVIGRVFRKVPNTNFWKGTKDACKDQNFDLEQTIRRLQEAQGTVGQYVETANQAEAEAAFRDNNRGREIKRRGRYRGGHGQSRSSSRVQKSDSKCYFCHIRGHFQKDCKKYASAQRAVLSKRTKTDGEAATIALVEEQIDDGPCYNCVQIANDESAYFCYSESSWVIDSGATRHFSFNRQDFQHLKRWQEPRMVRVANNSYCEAEGYGDIKLKIADIELVLKNAWFIPDFNCRLISPRILNEEGISVLFKDGKALIMDKRDNLI